MKQISEETEKELKDVLRHNVENHKGKMIDPFDLWGMDAVEQSKKAESVADQYSFSGSKAPVREWLMRAIEMDIHPLTIFAWYFTSVDEARQSRR